MLAELVPVVEIADEVVFQFQLADAECQDHDAECGSGQQGLAVGDDKLRDVLHRDGGCGPLGLAPDRQEDDQRRQERQRVDHACEDADADDVAKLAERRRDREVQAEEADRGGDAGDDDRAHVVSQGAAHPFLAVRCLDHCLPAGRQDMHRRGDRESHDVERRQNGHRVQLVSKPAGGAQAAERRQDDQDQHGQRSDDRPDRQTDDQQDQQEHRTEQRLAVALTRLGELVVDHHAAGRLQFDEVVLLLDIGAHRFVLVHDGGHLDDRVDARKREQDLDRGNGRTFGRQVGSADQLDPVQRRLLRPGCLLGGDVGRVLDEVADDHLVALGIGMLEVGDRIDPAHIGQQPGPFGDFADHAQDLGVENFSVFRNDGDDQVIVLVEGCLEPVQRDTVRVLLGKEDPGIGVGREDVRDLRHRQRDQNGRQSQPGPAHSDDEIRHRCKGFTLASVIRTHLPLRVNNEYFGKSSGHNVSLSTLNDEFFKKYSETVVLDIE